MSYTYAKMKATQEFGTQNSALTLYSKIWYNCEGMSLAILKKAWIQYSNKLIILVQNIFEKYMSGKQLIQKLQYW